MNDTRLSDEQDNVHAETRTAGEVAQLEQVRKEAAANAAQASKAPTVPAPKPETQEDETPKKEKVLDTPSKR